MSEKVPARERARRAGAPRAHDPAPPLPLRHPAMLAAAIVAAACVAISVSYRLYDSDLWQHLVVGRYLWQHHEVPNIQLWSWPTYGSFDVTVSWLFRALLWPFWSALGEWGLELWRLLTTLAAFGLLWAAARRMGARGFLPLVVIAGAALVYRQRSQVRPETLVAVLLGLQIWIHESKRNGGADRTIALPLVAMLWANAHISYWIGLFVQAVYAFEWLRSSKTADARARWRLAGLLALSIAASLLNPAGWRALAQPFEYWLTWRHELIFRSISELHPVNWSENVRNGLPLLVTLWPLLLLWRWRRRGLDLPELAIAATFIPLALRTQRFTGFLALAAVPFLARDLEEWVRSRTWPAWTRRDSARALFAVTACFACIPEWLTPQLPLGVALRLEWHPVAACDFMERHAVRGRGYNPFYFGGYLLWRFFPEEDRLPFMDIHQAGTPEDRRLAVLSARDPAAWARLDSRYRFDWVLHNRYLIEDDRSLDIADADSSFALVFLDDAAALYVRREGAMRAVADSFGYRLLAAGPAALGRMGARANRDSSFRAAMALEWTRAASESRFSAGARSMLASAAIAERRWSDARRELEAALAIEPHLSGAAEKLRLVRIEEARAAR